MPINDILPLCFAAYLDYGSTQYALNAGAKEFNPFMQNKSYHFAVKTGVCGGSSLIVWKLKKQKKTRAAKIVKYALIGLQVGASAWNIHVGINERKRK